VARGYHGTHHGPGGDRRQDIGENAYYADADFVDIGLNAYASWTTLALTIPAIGRKASRTIRLPSAQCRAQSSAENEGFDR
jgi:hypothetical protein